MCDDCIYFQLKKSEFCESFYKVCMLSLRDYRDIKASCLFYNNNNSLKEVSEKCQEEKEEIEE